MEQATSRATDILFERQLEGITIANVLDDLHTVRSALSRLTYGKAGDNDRYARAKRTLYRAHGEIVGALVAPLTESERKALEPELDLEPDEYDPELGF
ncbi:hypothetical protein [Rothia sp. ND6WE1A]|uniref:hypothetical protein n=1 Tax=Rothia sp. ND6WE1A TaxID=1848190 RepID=UPI00082A6852|nr:hypothetical protein [Rothia sp. ND6WE1A]